MLQDPAVTEPQALHPWPVTEHPTVVHVGALVLSPCVGHLLPLARHQLLHLPLAQKHGMGRVSLQSGHLD